MVSPRVAAGCFAKEAFSVAFSKFCKMEMARKICKKAFALEHVWKILRVVTVKMIFG